MKFGAQMYTVREFTQTNKDFATSVKKIAGLGYECLHISSVKPDIPVEEIAETCQAHELEIIITNADPVRILKETDEVIREHQLMGAKYIGIGSLPKDYEHTREGFRRFITDFIPAAREIRDAGLRFVYHNHHYEFEKFDGKLAIDYLINQFADVHFCLDTFWVQAGGGDPAYWIKKLAGRVDILHLKDCTVIRDKRAMCEVLEGNLNWSSIFKASEEAGVKYLMVEQDDCYGKDPFECLRVGLQNLKREYAYLANVNEEVGE